MLNMNNSTIVSRGVCDSATASEDNEVFSVAALASRGHKVPA